MHNQKLGFGDSCFVPGEALGQTAGDHHGHCESCTADHGITSWD